MKDRRMKMLVKTANSHQRFSIRKLTIGAASVLLGTSIYLGTSNGDVQAAENTDSEKTDSALVTAPQSSVSSNELERDSQPSQYDESSNINKESQNLEVNKNTQRITTNEVKENKSKTSPIEAQKPTFSGSVTFNPPKQINAGETQDISYDFSSIGGNEAGTSKTSSFYFMIPAGFKSNSFTWTYQGKPVSDIASIGSLQNLGFIGSQGEETYLVNINGAVNFNNQLLLKATIEAQSASAGQYMYQAYGNQLIFGTVNDFASYGNRSEGGGEDDVTLKDGKKYKLIRNALGLNNSYDKIEYTIIPGGKALVAGQDYDLTNLHATTSNGSTVTDSGYEELSVKINLKKQVTPGSYMDFKMGVPLADGTYLLYDNNLGSSEDLEKDNQVYAHLYNLGTYYRLVFIDNVNQYITDNSSFSTTLHLRWGNNSNQSSINAKKVFLYKYTDDNSNNGQTFTTVLEDININGQKYSSGLKVTGEYVAKEPTLEGNKYTTSGIIATPNRIWDKNGNVRIYTDFSNSVGVSIATHARKSGSTDSSTSNIFDIKVSVGKNNLFTYNWATEKDLEDQIAKAFAPYVSHTLSEKVIGNEGYYTKDKTQDNHDASSTVKVTISDSSDEKTFNKTYHVEISDPNIQLKGSIFPLTVIAHNLTMPEGIKSYGEDLAAGKKTMGGNYGGNADGASSPASANSSLIDALKSTRVALVSVINDTTKTDALPTSGANWQGQISYNGYETVNDASDPQNIVTTSLSFKNMTGTDEAHATNFDNASQLLAQGSGVNPIIFNGANNELTNLSKFKIVKVVAVNRNGQVTSLPLPTNSNLENYNFGDFKTAREQGFNFVVYLQKDSSHPATHTKTVTETITYTFQNEDGNPIPIVSRANDNQALTFTRKWSDSTQNYIWSSTQSFPTFPIKPESGYELFSAKIGDQDVLNENNGSIKEIPHITHNSQDVIVNVIFRKLDQTVPYNIYYIDVTGKPLPSNLAHLKPSDGTEIIGHEIKNIIGKIGNKSDASLWDYTKDGYDLVYAPENLGKQTFESKMNNQYVYLKKNTSEPQTIETTIHFVDLTAKADKNQLPKDLSQLKPSDGKLLSQTIQENGKAGDKFNNPVVLPQDYTMVYEEPLISAGKLLANIPTNLYIYVKQDIKPPVITTTSVEDQRTVTETIHYVYSDGSQADVPYTKTITFTRSGEKYSTGEVIWNNWTPISATFPKVVSPEILGYTPNSAEIESIIVAPSSSNIDKTVIYTKQHTDKPKNDPDPTRSSDPNTNKPNAENVDMNTNPHATTVTGTTITTTTNYSDISYRPLAKKKPVADLDLAQRRVDKGHATLESLPQTGSNNILSLIGIAFTSLVAVLGLNTRKRKN